jgi:hypothetical protein
MSHSCGLPLEKARWLPRYLAPSAPPQERQPTPPPTPMQRKDDEPISQAWDPSSVLPGESSGTGPTPTAPKPGKDKLAQLPMLLGLQPVHRGMAA